MANSYAVLLYHDHTYVCSQVVSGGMVVRTLELNSSLAIGSEVVTGLDHESSYSFSATLVNSANMNAVYTSRATTTVGKSRRFSINAFLYLTTIAISP